MIASEYAKEKKVKDHMVKVRQMPVYKKVIVRYEAEKERLFKDPEFKKILLDKFKIKLEPVKMGGLEMIGGDMTKVDAIWPSSVIAAEIFKTRNTGAQFKVSNIFSTPVIFYSWPSVIDALMKAELVEKRGEIYYLSKLKKFYYMASEQKTWKELGLSRQNGYISSITSQPARSNLGFMTSGLIAIMLNDGNMVTDMNVNSYIETVYRVYQNMGILDESSVALFDRYLKQGQGALPLITGYENMLIELYLANPKLQDFIKESVRVVVPEPTVWADHPMISLTKNGDALMEALKSSEIQQLAWRKYGFRSGVLGTNNDTTILNTLGLPERIESVTLIPAPSVMIKILTVLQ